MVAVRWYLRHCLSYRDVDELLVERGVEVDHVSLFQWVQRFTPLLADAARFARHAPGDRDDHVRSAPTVGGVRRRWASPIPGSGGWKEGDHSRHADREED